MWSPLDLCGLEVTTKLVPGAGPADVDVDVDVDERCASARQATTSSTVPDVVRLWRMPWLFVPPCAATVMSAVPGEKSPLSTISKGWGSLVQIGLSPRLPRTK